MFRINPFKTSREEKSVPNKPIKASVRTKPITVSQPHVITKKNINSDSLGLSSTEIDNTAKTGRPHPRSNTKNDRVPSASKSSCNKNKEVEVEVHPRNLLLSKNKKHMSSEYSGCSKHKTGNLKLLINFIWKFLGTVYFGNDHVAVILGYGDLQWGNILITRVNFIEGLGLNLFSVGQLYDSDLEMMVLRAKLKTAPSFTVDLTKHHTSSLTAENQTSYFYMYSGLSVILRMIVKTLGNLVQKVTLVFLLILVLTDLKLGLQSMTSRQISSGLDLTYAPSTITTQQPTEHELDLLFEAMYDDYIGGQPSTATRIAPAAQAP
ncbi:hypothetical protein Tco_0902662 [Tanacetum coccineum]